MTSRSSFWMSAEFDELPIHRIRIRNSTLNLVVMAQSSELKKRFLEKQFSRGRQTFPNFHAVKNVSAKPSKSLYLEILLHKLFN